MDANACQPKERIADGLWEISLGDSKFMANAAEPGSRGVPDVCRLFADQALLWFAPAGMATIEPRT